MPHLEVSESGDAGETTIYVNAGRLKLWYNERTGTCRVTKEDFLTDQRHEQVLTAERHGHERKVAYKPDEPVNTFDPRGKF